MKKLFAILIALLISTNAVLATQLPSEVEAYIKKSFPKATVRFDGLVTLPDGTMYLPLFPSLSPKGKTFGVKTSVPQNSEISQKPELLIFNNNFALIKLLKQKGGGYKVYFQEYYPTEVMTSILPQDLLVPRGLILPDSLESILGNLVIPTTSAISYSKIAPKNVPTVNNGIPVIKKEEKVVQSEEALKNKLFFVSNSDSKTIKIVHSDSAEPQFTFRLPNVPQDMVASQDNQYLFVLLHGQNVLDVIDIKREEIVKQIDFEVQPNEIILSKDGKKLYVASETGNAIFVVDVKDMMITQKIKVMGTPRYLTYSSDYSKIYYYDKASSNIYSLEFKAPKTKGPNIINTEIFACPNASAMKIKGSELFIISRTRNKLVTYSLEINEVIAETDLPEKPVDLLIDGDFLHVLCAKDNKILVINTQNGEIVKIVSLLTNGFAKKFNRVKNTNIVLVSDSQIKGYNVYDLNEKKVVQKNKLNIPVSVITIVDKTGIDKL